MISNVRTCVALKGLTIQHSRQGSVDGKDDEDDDEIDINEIEDDDDFVINFDQLLVLRLFRFARYNLSTNIISKDFQKMTVIEDRNSQVKDISV